VRGGWGKPEAENVVHLNRFHWFDTHQRISPEALQKELDLLCNKLNTQNPRFGHSAKQFLRKYPRVSGIMALSNNPDAFANAFDDFTQEEVRVLLDSYASYCEREDVKAWTKVVKAHGRQIVSLYRRGLPTAPVTLFTYPKDTIVAKEYGSWLNKCLNYLFKQTEVDSDEVLPYFITYAATAGSSIRKSMRNEEIRNQFIGTLWPRYERVVFDNGKKTEYYDFTTFHDPYVWDLLAKENGEMLLLGGGLSAVDKLVGPNAYSSLSAREALEDAIHSEEELLLSSFLEFGNKTGTQNQLAEEKFLQIAGDIYRDKDLFRKFCHRLKEKGGGWQVEIDKLHKHHENGILHKELAPEPSGTITYIPGFAIWYAIEKGLDGRDVSGMEMLMAGVEAAFVLIPGGLAVSRGGQVVIKEAAKKAMKRTVLDMTKATGRRLTMESVENSSIGILRQLGRLIVKQGKKINQEWEKGMSVDITNATRSLFRNSAIGRRTFRKMTNLDARLFMRKDATVFLHLGKSTKAVAKIIAVEMAVSTAIGEILAVHSVQQGIANSAQFLSVANDKLKKFFKDSPSLEKQIGEQSTEELRRMQLSSWWLMNASGRLQAPPDKPNAP